MANNIIGKGIIFPIELNNGAPVIRTDNELIKSSIAMILGWPDRDRFFIPEFGSRLEELLEEPNDQVILGVMNYFIKTTLKKWEPRIRVDTVRAYSKKPESLQVVISYTIIRTNKGDSFVFPFYKYRLI